MIVNTLKKDFLASIIVFLVALPLAIGISIACGLPIYSGIVAGIIGGIVVGAFSGNSLQVSGPAAGLILIIVDIMQTMGVENKSYKIISKFYCFKNFRISSRGSRKEIKIRKLYI